MDIPVFHDDQHGTAIITTAALINALDICGKSIKKIKVKVNGAGASALLVLSYLKTQGKIWKYNNARQKGVIYEGRTGELINGNPDMQLKLNIEL